MDATDRKNVNTSCGDTVKCRLDAGKSHIFDRKVRVRIYVQESQRFCDFVPIYIYVKCPNYHWSTSHSYMSVLLFQILQHIEGVILNVIGIILQQNVIGEYRLCSYVLVMSGYD